MSDKRIKEIFTVFEQLQHLTREKDKLRLLDKIKGYPEAKWILQIVLSKAIKTYISHDVLVKLPCGNKQIATFKEFQDLVNKLTQGKLKGKDKLDAVTYFLQRCDTFHCKWYKRILAKDLRAGIGKTLAIKVFGFKEADFGIKFKVMKAMEVSSVPNIDKLTSQHKWAGEIKIDGLRCITVFDKGTFECFSRNSKRLYGAEKVIVNGLNSNVIKQLQGYVLDGEFYTKNWSDTMTSIMRKSEIPSRIKLSDMRYYLFDVIPIRDMKAKICRTPYIQRKKLLQAICKKLQHPFEYVDYTIITEPVLDNATKLANKYIKQGWEGLVLKAIDGVYECRRSKLWLKIKKFKTLDLRCVDIIPSTKREEISAIVFTYKGKKCRCGSGFSQEQREHFLKHPEDIIGKIVEIKYQEISKDGCLRFPVFVRIRLDKDTPDA